MFRLRTRDHGLDAPLLRRENYAPALRGQGDHVSITRPVTLLAAACLLAAHSATHAAFHSYYVGIDNLTTVASGTYAGLPNPNYQRLTFLYAHTYPDAPSTNHYHSKGTQVYTGPNLGGSTQVTTSPSNFVPEGTNPPIALQPGTGLYAGKLVSTPYSLVGETYHWSDTTIGNTQSLAGFGPTDGESYLFNSSAGRWNAPFNAADIHWELVSLTPGLNVGNASQLNIVLSPGDDVHVGEGDQMFEFTPLFWTEVSAPNGVYEARFRLVDESGTYGSSGEIRVLTVVPEPAMLSAVASVFALVRRRR